jgi:Ca2+-binding RTX toxin-like protein
MANVRLLQPTDMAALPEGFDGGALVPTPTSNFYSLANPRSTLSIALAGENFTHSLLALTGGTINSVEIDDNDTDAIFNIRIEFPNGWPISLALGQEIFSRDLPGAVRMLLDDDDTIDGSDGDDRILGFKGNDKLTGGKHEDTFVFDTKLNKNKNVDKITDMKPDTDTIALDKGIFKGIGSSLSKKEFEVGLKADDKKDRVIYADKTGKLYHDANGDSRTMRMSPPN